MLEIAVACSVLTFFASFVTALASIEEKTRGRKARVRARCRGFNHCNRVLVYNGRGFNSEVSAIHSAFNGG